MLPIRGFATENEAIQAAGDEGIVIVLNGRPCVASKSFTERLRRTGVTFQTVWRDRDVVFQVDFPLPLISSVEPNVLTTDLPAPTPL
jgi:hypothetical protein